MTWETFTRLVPTRILDSAEDTLARIHELGGYVRKSGNNWVIQCPHPDHPDLNPSASLTAGDAGQALVHCFACPDSNSPKWLDEVSTRLAEGVEFQTAQPRRRTASSGTARGERVAEYGYIDGNGRRFYKTRFVSDSGVKSFEWSRDVDGARVTGLGRTDLASLLPFPADHLAEAHSDVLWVEGEKDVLRALNAGLFAVTSGGGASGPLPVDLSCLRGKRVVIVADNDPAGIKYALRVKAALEGIAEDISVALPGITERGADLSDHLDAGLGIEDLIREPPEALANEIGDSSVPAARKIVLTPASDIAIRPVTWLWKDRLAEGTLALLAGREGQGKSTVAAWLIASVTRGTLPGVHNGSPKSVFISATEDSWESTIVPRLHAANADLTRVFRIEVVSSRGTYGDLSMPADIPMLTELARERDVVLLVLDPMMSRIDSSLDTHRDAEVRLALEPLAGFAHETEVTVMGLAHFNKSTNADPLNAVMASKAFTAVARSVHTVIRDSDDESCRYFGTAKNNLGRDDLPMLAFSIEGVAIPIADQEIWTSKIVWGEEVHESVRDAMARANDPTDRGAVQEASDWLEDYLLVEGGKVASADIKKAGRAAGHSESAVKRAKLKLGLIVNSRGFPRETIWQLPERPVSPLGSPISPSHPTEPTEPHPPASLPGSGSGPNTVKSDTEAESSPQPVQSAQSDQQIESGQLEPTVNPNGQATITLRCLACGLLMLEDFFGDGRHPNCI